MSRIKNRRKNSQRAISFAPPTAGEPRQVGAAEFKAHCLELMDEVDQRRIEIVITKHRVPVARLVPVDRNVGTFAGSLRGLVSEAGDLISPIDEPWSVDL